MALGKFIPEKQFLIKLALDQYNRQYKKNIQAEQCVIYSIRPAYQQKWGYEIATTVQNDFVRLRIYLKPGQYDRLENYRLEVDDKFQLASLGDEVYVTLGQVQQGYIDDGIYRFRWIEDTYSEASFLTDMGNEPIALMSGGFLQLSGE